MLTLFVQPGAGYDPSAPLPSVSAVYWNGSTGEAMPLLQVNQTEAACNVPPNSGCTNLLAVTVQVPFDAYIIPSAESNVIVVQSSVASSINGATTYFGVQPSQDHIDIQTACDLIAGASPAFLAYQGTYCAPLVTHADGKTVSAILPATAGEELIAYATGLGQTNPALTTGHPAAQSSPTVDAFNLDFNYRNTFPPPNLSPRALFHFLPGEQPRVLSASTRSISLCRPRRPEPCRAWISRSCLWTPPMQVTQCTRT